MYVIAQEMKYRNETSEEAQDYFFPCDWSRLYSIVHCMCWRIKLSLHCTIYYICHIIRITIIPMYHEFAKTRGIFLTSKWTKKRHFFTHPLWIYILKDTRQVRSVFKNLYTYFEEKMWLRYTLFHSTLRVRSY